MLSSRDTSGPFDLAIGWRLLASLLLSVAIGGGPARAELAAPDDRAAAAATGTPANVGASLCASAPTNASTTDQAQFLRAVKEDVLYRLRKNANAVPEEWTRKLADDVKKTRFWSGINEIYKIRGKLCWYNPDVNPLLAPIDESTATHLRRLPKTVKTAVTTHQGFTDAEKKDLESLIESLKGPANPGGSRKIKESENACAGFQEKLKKLKDAAEINQAEIASNNPLTRYIQSANPTAADIENAKKALLADTKKAIEKIESISFEGTLSSDAESLLLMSGSVQGVLQKNPALCGGYRTAFEKFQQNERFRSMVNGGLAVAGTATCIGAAYFSAGILGAACFVSTASLTAGSAERYWQVADQAGSLNAASLGKGAKYDDVLAKQREANGLLVETGLSAAGLKFGLGTKGVRAAESGLATAEVNARRVADDALAAPALAAKTPKYESTTKATGVLGRELSDAQIEAVESAHRVGRGLPGKDGTPAGVGNYTWAQLREKQKLLKSAGFRDDEIRRLMEKGVVGDMQGSRQLLYPTGDASYDTFRAAYNSGKVSDDAKYVSFISRETLGQRIAAKVVKMDGGQTVLEDAQGVRYVLQGRDLESVRVSSTARDALDSTLQFRRSYEAGELARLQGERAVITYRPENATQNYAAKVVGVRPDGKVEVQLYNGERHVLSRSELISAKFSSTETRKDYMAAAAQFESQARPGSDVARIFTQQKGKTVGADEPYQSPRRVASASGEKVQFMVRSTPDFREAAASKGLIKEFNSPGAAKNLPPGTYTYLITRDGRLVVGKVEDTFELGVKHQNLANGREVVSAGELKIGSDGSSQFNTLSGTYTYDIVRSGQVSEPELLARTQRALDSYLGGRVNQAHGDLLPKQQPSTSTIRWACMNREFLAHNLAGCCAMVGIGCN